MKTLVLANQKGGVGKSAVATLLAHYFVQRGQRVLAVDFDHQGNFSSTLGLSGRTHDAGQSADKLLADDGTRVPARPFVLVPAAGRLLDLERQHAKHTQFARNFRSFVESSDADFDVCIVDTNPNPDIRLVSALTSADFVLSPLQLKQESVDGVHQLLSHQRVGVLRIKALLNPKLTFIGLLLTLVEATPFQRANLVEVAQAYGHLLIKIGAGQCARIPNRSAIAEAQASGEVLWEIRKTAARDAWREIEPSIAHIAGLVLDPKEADAASH